METRIALLLLANLKWLLAFPNGAKEITTSYNPSQRWLPESEYVTVNDVRQTSIMVSNNEKILKFSKKPVISEDAVLRFLEANKPATISASEKQTKQIAFNRWSNPSCCRFSRRHQQPIQVRIRMRSNGAIDVQSRTCSTSTCADCTDVLLECPVMKYRHKACDLQSEHHELMTIFCPRSCRFCRNPFSPPRPPPPPPPPPPITMTTIPITTTTVPAQTSSLRQVKIYFSPRTFPYLYRFSTIAREPDYPWLPVSRSRLPGEVESFYMSARRTGVYFSPAYFCTTRRSILEIWRIQRSQCFQGWSQVGLLYYSPVPLPGSKRIFVTTNQRGLLGSRVHSSFSCCGNTSNTWTFFSPSEPTSTTTPPIPPLPTTNSPSLPTSTNRPPLPPLPSIRPPYPPLPFTQPPYPPLPSTQPPYPLFPTTRPPFPTTRPTFPPSPGGSVNECLQSHNAFRRAHGVPDMQWDPELARTAQAWAEILKSCAEEGPGSLPPERLRRRECQTRNWPHSNGNGDGRPSNTGENIAWDLSFDGSALEESVLRWYAEIFDFNPNQPTTSSTGRPIGHYTQMIWRDSVRLGCGKAVFFINRGSYTQLSTWTVAHYAPAGNIRYRDPFQNINVYRNKVPALLSGNCRPQCGGEFGCIGFGINGGCSCSGTNPVCQGGSGGCIASCPTRSFTGSWNGECQGRTSCQCTSNRGAVCT